MLANYRTIALQVLGILGSYASLVSIFLPLQPDVWTGWRPAIGVLSLMLLVAVVGLQLAEHRSRSMYPKEDAAGIQAYMQRWISKSGRIAIWSRDLTWANVSEVRELLLEKARNHELTLCVPRGTALTTELTEAGADVYVYGVGDYVPASRFTIADFERHGARVAVGRAEGDLHVIEEFDASTHPAFYLAQDLVNLVRAFGSSRASGS
jgi:hypothetical protein